MSAPICEKCQQPMTKNVAKRYFCRDCQRGRPITLKDPPIAEQYLDGRRGRLVTYKKRSHH